MNPHGDVYRDWDVAYVLGSLSPPERRAYERHLNTCLFCVHQIASLAGMPGILSTVPGGHAAEMLGADSCGVARPSLAFRRSARTRVVAALACAAALGALLVIARCLSPSE